jgi:hypothetical protein
MVERVASLHIQTCKFFMAIESTTIYPEKLLAPLDFGP